MASRSGFAGATTAASSLSTPVVRPTARFEPTSVQDSLPALITLVGLLALYVPVALHGIDVWRSDPEFSFGFAVGPAALSLLWFRRKELVESVAGSSPAGLVVLVGGLALFLLSVRTNVHALAGASLLPVVVGAVAFLYGPKTARLAAFPVAFLTAGLSLYRGMLNPLGFGMQQATASLSASLASLLGVPVHQVGVDLFARNLHLVVAQACSGMDSLVALLCLGLLMVGISGGSLVGRAVLLTTVLPVILVANVVRVTLVLVLYPWLSSSITTGSLHEVLDVVVFLGAGALFWLIGELLKCGPVFRVTR